MQIVCSIVVFVLYGALSKFVKNLSRDYRLSMNLLVYLKRLRTFPTANLVVIT